MKRNFQKATALVLSTLTSSCLLTTYTGNNFWASANEEALKLGSLFPTTGDLSAIGQNMPVAADLAVTTINACGGVNGQPVTLINEDDQTDPAAGASAMTKLAEVDGVAGVVGSFASSVSTAAVDIAVRNKIMLISPGSTSPVFTDRAKNGDFDGFWARTAPPDTYQARALAALVKKQGLTRVSTVVINNDYGVGFEEQFVTSFEGLGGTIVNRDNPVRYEPKATTLDTEAAAAFNGDVEGVAAILYAETGSILLQSAYKQGLTDNVTVFLTDGVFSPDFVEQVGKTSDGKSVIAGALGTVPGASGSSLADFTVVWTESTGEEVTAFVPHTWDATVLLMLAAEAAKSNTGEGISSKIREVANAPGVEVSDPCEAIELIRSGQDINYQGASGDVDIDENGDVVGNYDVWRVNDDGTLEVFDTIAPAL
jgi:neutral amino acid transport system substrate-binding protein